MGYGDQVGYDQLVQRVCNAQIDKSSRFTDWAARPLSDKQLTYALADVTYLRDVYKRLFEDLAKLKRSEWVADEMRVLASPSTYETKPMEAWQRVKVRVKKPRELAVLIEVCAWREREAQARDVPRGRILKDDAIGEIIAQMPKSPEALGALRSLSKGMSARSLGRFARSYNCRRSA